MILLEISFFFIENQTVHCIHLSNVKESGEMMNFNYECSIYLWVSNSIVSGGVMSSGGLLYNAVGQCYVSVMET